MSVWIWKSDWNHFSEGTDAITAAWGGVRTIFGLVGGTSIPERLQVGFTFSLCYVIAALRSTCVLTHACSSNFPLSSITAAGCTFAWCPRTHTCPPLPAPFFFFCRFEQAAATKAERSFSCHSFETNRKLTCEASLPVLLHSFKTWRFKMTNHPRLQSLLSSCLQPAEHQQTTEMYRSIGFICSFMDIHEETL